MLSILLLVSRRLVCNVLLIILISYIINFLISKGLGLATNLSRTIIQDKSKKKGIRLNYQQYRKQVAKTQKVLYTIQIVRPDLPLLEEALF